ncbi:mandelate racemase/muconate lactonizing enzyme family protein [Alphaproteobacteria bacterium]|nr:mandelate racemase/muconate lactonizing enzyme family protein [Alphaproteobacteria bacterium]
MLINKIQTIRTPEHPNLIWVKVYTDDGLFGLGETWFGAESVESDIHSRLASLLIGQDPTRIEYIYSKMRPYIGFFGTGVEMRALSALDVAIWDLYGKIKNMPLYDLLGGKTKSNIKVYNTCAGPNYVSQNADVRPDNFGTDKIKDTKSKLYEDLEMFMDKPEDLASSLLDMGIKSMKIWPFDFAKGAKTGLEISNYDLKKYIQPFERIRKAHGSNIKIKAELHGIWSLEASKKICKALEDYDMCWIEDPIWMDRLDDIPKLAMTTDQPLAGGETLGGLGQIRQLIEISDIAYPIIDVTWGGGITFAKKAAAIAESHMKSIAFHDCSGPITLAVSTHLALACSNVIEQEITRGFYYGWYHELVTELPIIENGMISVSNKPGLGMDLSNDLLKKSDIIIKETT